MSPRRPRLVASGVLLLALSGLCLVFQRWSSNKSQAPAVNPRTAHQAKQKQDSRLAMHGADFNRWIFEADWTSGRADPPRLQASEALHHDLIRRWPRITSALIVITSAQLHSTFVTDMPARASVMLKLRDSEPLSKANVASITNMVANAVPDLDAENVKISDGVRLYRLQD